MSRMLRSLSAGILLVGAGCGLANNSDDPVTERSSPLLAALNDLGTAETFHITRAIDFTNPFFQNHLGPSYCLQRNQATRPT
jgi:hypothetical protein